MKRFLCVVSSILMMLGVIACSDDNASDASGAQNESSESSIVSSAAEGVNSSGAENSGGGAENSSSDAGSSSSAAKPPSGITEPCTTPEPVSDMWYGPAAVAQSIYHANTGLDNGTETSGYWFSFENEDGDAGVVWPDRSTYENSMDPVVDFCRGVCGTFDFKNEGVTGIGFNVAGIVSWDHEVPDFADASAWGGLCVTYASESDLVVAMSTDTTYAYVNNLASMPKASLPKSLEVNTICSKWDDFVSPAGTTGNSTHLASVIFAVRGAAGTQSKFNIIGVGKYADARNVCEQGAEPFVAGKN